MLASPGAAAVDLLSSPALLAALLALLAAFLLYRHLLPARARLPQLSWTEYLPGRPAYVLHVDSRAMSRILMRFREQLGDVFMMRLGFNQVLVTAHPADVATIVHKSSIFLRTPAALATLNIAVPDGIATLEHRAHHAARKGIRGVFSADLLEGFWPSLERALAVMVDDLDTGRKAGVFDVSQVFARMTFRLILNVAFGATADEDTVSWISALSSGMVKDMLADLLGYPVRGSPLLAWAGLQTQYREASADMRAYFEGLLRARIAETPESKSERSADLLDAIIGLEGEKMCQKVSHALSFGVAGSHTTAETSAWAVVELCSAPEVAAKFVEEIDRVLGASDTAASWNFDQLKELKYVNQVWKETLRLHPPGPVFMRMAARDTLLPGSKTAVKENQLVLGFLYAAQRDAGAWSHPDTFIPERFDPDNGEAARAPPGTNLPFSAGPYNCPGQFLANAEGVLILCQLYKRYNVELAVDRSEVVSVSGYAECARTDDPTGPPGNLARGIPIRLTLR